jgi:hypothetical protein
VHHIIFNFSKLKTNDWGSKRTPALWLCLSYMTWRNVRRYMLSCVLTISPNVIILSWHLTDISFTSLLLLFEKCHTKERITKDKFLTVKTLGVYCLEEIKTFWDLFNIYAYNICPEIFISVPRLHRVYWKMWYVRRCSLSMRGKYDICLAFN